MTAPGDSKGAPSGRALATGALLWLAFAVVAVTLRGVAWDEAYERAQVLTGRVPYPAWHPLYQYAYRAFGLHYLTAAALLKVTDSALVVCGARNVLHVWMTILPVFLIGASLSRRLLWGHAAAVLAFLGVHLQFSSYYPLFVWPDMFTSGHMGLGYALCTLWAWMTGRVRLGALLLCAMPLVHVGQMPPVLGAVGLVTGWNVLRGYPTPWRRVLPWALLGGVTVVLYAVIRWAMLPDTPATSPFVAAGDWHDAWARYTAHNDVHRAYPRYGEVGDSLVALAGAMMLAGLLWLSGQRRAAWWGIVYGALCMAAYLAGIAAVRVFGEAVPFLFVAWMPQRLSNHAAVLLIAMVCGLLGLQRGAGAGAARVMLLGALALEATKPALGWILPDVLYERYVAPPEMGLFLLFGAALFLPLRERWGTWKGLGGGAVVIAALGAYHQTGAAYAFLGVGSAAVLAIVLNQRKAWLVPAPALGIVGAVCLSAALLPAWQGRESLPRSSWDGQVAEALRGDPNAMLVTPHWDISVQERTGHPVLATYETHQFTPYVPTMAAGIEQLYWDVYGQKFGAPWRYRLDAWSNRPAETWRVLGARYGFGYVVSPVAVPLPLEVVLRGELHVLYRVME